MGSPRLFNSTAADFNSLYTCTWFQDRRGGGGGVGGVLCLLVVVVVGSFMVLGGFCWGVFGVTEVSQGRSMVDGGVSLSRLAYRRYLCMVGRRFMVDSLSLSLSTNETPINFY